MYKCPTGWMRTCPGNETHSVISLDVTELQLRFKSLWNLSLSWHTHLFIGVGGTIIITLFPIKMCVPIRPHVRCCAMYVWTLNLISSQLCATVDQSRWLDRTVQELDSWKFCHNHIKRTYYCLIKINLIKVSPNCLVGQRRAMGCTVATNQSAISSVSRDWRSWDDDNDDVEESIVNFMRMLLSSR